ncbi:putative sugar kinase in cluster with indigoidine synthase indA, PfkB family of kinase [Rhodovulum sp. P5]|nr:putative sugar kinase in cluster with indigoidine synthase indA, PfkB family of kinase [Rhodovulum sp. P5]
MIGRANRVMGLGDDVPGRITRRPGGVALNVAVVLARSGLNPAVLGAVGRDVEGDALLAACSAMGVDTRHVFRSPDHPTDIYMAVEAEQGLVAAIADAAGLEAAGPAILAPLIDGPLGRTDAPFDGIVAIDGNLPPALLSDIAQHPAFAAADLRISPASPGKAERIAHLMGHPRATVYVNRAEAGLIAGRAFGDASEAARTLIASGVARAIVTDGGRPTVFATADGCISQTPPPVAVAHVTGAGDTLMAAHIVAERAGASRDEALTAALRAAAKHISTVPA